MPSVCIFVELQPGLTVLTGETGAGKSIIIDAIELALGARAQGPIVRKGAERCQISLSFDLQNNPQALAWLQQHDLNDDYNCIIRRVIYQDGRTKSQINGQATPLAQARALGCLLVNIHGQHQHQLLLKKDAQRQSLDQFGALLILVNQVRATYLQWQTAQTQLTQITTQSQANADHIKLLSYQVAELDELNLEAHQFTLLETEHKKLSRAEEYFERSSQVMTLLDDNTASEQATITTKLHHCLNDLKSMTDLDPAIQNTVQLLKSALIQTEEATSTLQNFINKIEISPEKLQHAEQRLMTLHDLARKHHVEPEDLFEHSQKLHNELAALKCSDETIAELEHQLKQLSVAYLTTANKLSSKRKVAAKKLQTAITTKMHTLGMPGGQFEIKLNKLDDYSANGLEKVQFLVSTNPGETLQPLDKVISGGELSRISLSIEAITAERDQTPMLIFDEVDVGIGGGTAEVVGKLLKQLSQTAQCLCITHLPQVASLGDQHLKVSKTVTNNKTQTAITPLKSLDTTQEIARMLGGVKVTKQTLAHAKEMRALAQVK